MTEPELELSDEELSDEELVNVEFEDDIPIELENLKKNLSDSKFLIKKDFFIKHLQNKICKLNDSNRYLDHKYNDYLNSYNNLSISVIVLSSILTLIEAFSEIYNVNDIKSFYLKSSLRCLPLIVSTIVSVIATLVRFLKYQEHLERLGITGEKSVVAISKLKRIREVILFSEDENEFNSIVEIYLSETYETYNEVNIKVSLELNDNDYILYKNNIDDLDINIENNKP